LSSSSNYDFQPSSNLTKGVKWLFIVNIAIFFLAQVPAAREVLYPLAFQPSEFRPYQWLTYMFLHFEAMHLFFNMLSLFFVGIAVEQVLRTREFMAYYLTCGVGGALLGYVVSLFGSVPMVLGASGAVFGLFYALYRIYPEAVVQVFFVLPVKLKYVLLVMGLISLAMVLDRSSGVAHFAHLGGLLTGMAWFRYSDSFVYLYRQWKSKRIKQDVIETEQVKKGVDEILAKISREGMGALTKKERQFLNKASNHFKD